MEKTISLIVFLSMVEIILITILIFSGSNFFQNISGLATVNYYSYTKAICNENNYCEDYEINCEGNKVSSMKFTGAAIQNSFNWKDPRDKETIERLC